jgi:tripartite-type tricarboxylate transporter receptor subunit TctC
MNRFTPRVSGTALIFAIATWACAQDFPARPVRLVVPFAAGGTSDIVARLIAPKLGEGLGQAVVVENRGGAATLIGTRAVLQAPPDGHTLLLNTTSMATNSVAYKSPGYRMQDFVPIAPVISQALALSVHNAVPALNISEFIAHARTNPGRLNAVSFGPAAITTLVFERFKAANGLDIVSVNYAGSGPANQAMIAGTVNVFLDGISTAVQASKSGQTRILGVTTGERAALAPNVLTFREQGHPAITLAVWTAIFANAKVPEAAVRRLRSEFVRVLAIPDVREKIAALGFDVWAGRADDFPAYLRDDLAALERDVRRAGIALDE